MKAQIRSRNNGTRSMLTAPKRCAYRGADNNACAVGCFIPDGLYDSTMEDIGAIEYLLTRCSNLKSHMPLSLDGLVEMQKVHDSSYASVRDELCEWIDENVK